MPVLGVIFLRHAANRFEAATRQIEEDHVEETFAKLIELANSLDAERQRAVREGLSDDELALFDLLFKENISQADREKVKQASKGLLASLQEVLKRMHDWTQNTATQAEVKIFILGTERQRGLLCGRVTLPRC
jgi:type I restriction enzyme R subunit